MKPDASWNRGRNTPARRTVKRAGRAAGPAASSYTRWSEREVGDRIDSWRVQQSGGRRAVLRPTKQAIRSAAPACRRDLDPGQPDRCGHTPQIQIGDRRNRGEPFGRALGFGFHLMTTLYEMLGVSKDATSDEIKSAYRKLAKQLHPDLNPSDAAAEARFKQVAAAFDILGDPDKRAQYDRGEIDETGQERPKHSYYKHYAGQDGAAHYGKGGSFEDLGGIFGDLFGRRAGGAEFEMRGRDSRYHLTVDFIDAAKGAKQPITLPDGTSLNVDVPEGVRDGQTIRLRGKGEPGFGGGPPGDALIEIGIRPHPVFSRDDYDIVMELPVAIDEAILGAKVEVETLDGPVRVTIPKGASSGLTLRLKSKGIRDRRTGRRGAQKCVLKLVLPEEIDQGLEACMAEWRANHAYNPRQGIKRP